MDGERLREVLKSVEARGACGTAIFGALKDGRLTLCMRPQDGSPRVFLPEDGMRELLPQEDEKLPGLRLLDASCCREALGIQAADLPSVRLLAWRWAARAVLAVQGAGGELHFVKLLKKRAFAPAKRLFDALRRSAAADLLSLPVRELPEDAAFVFEPAGARSLHSMLRESDSGAIDAHARSALVASLAALGNATAEIVELPPRGLEDELASSKKMLGRGLRFLPALQQLLDELARLDATALPPLAGSGLVHGDLHDKQLFLGTGVCRLIDLEGMRLGPPVLDRMNLLVHLELREQQFGASEKLRELIREVREAFPELALGDDPGTPEGIARSLATCRLAGVYAQRPASLDLARTLTKASASRLRAL